MKTTIENTGPCRKRITVEAPEEMVEEIHSEVLAAISRVAALDGFRKGKAPPDLVKRRFAANVEEDSSDRLIAKTYRAAISEHGVTPLAIIDVDKGDAPTPGKPWKYAFTLDVPPEFKLPRYKGLSLRGRKIEVTDEDVERAVEAMRNSMATFVDAEPDYAAGRGDIVQAHGEALTPEGLPHPEITKVLEQFKLFSGGWILLSENNMPPGLPMRLVGVRKGESKTIEVALPEGDESLPEFLRGKTAVYKVEIEALRRRVMPELDAEFLSRLGAESAEKLRERVREELLLRKKEEENTRLRREALSTLLEKTSMEVPQSVLFEEAGLLYAREARRAELAGEKKTDIEAKKEQMVGESLKRAYVQVCMNYIMARIAHEEKITVEENEFEEYVKRLAVYRGVSLEVMQETMAREHTAEEIRSDILFNKTVEFIMQNAEIAEGGFFSRIIGGITSRREGAKEQGDKAAAQEEKGDKADA